MRVRAGSIGAPVGVRTEDGWIDMGPGQVTRIRTGTSAIDGIGGRAVGQMVPAPTTGAIPLRAPAGFRSNSPMGMKRLP